MPVQRPRRGSPDVFDFEGTGDDARQWLDAAYGTKLRLSGRLGTVSHHRVDHAGIGFDHLKIDAAFAFDSDPMPVLVVVDMLRGHSEYTRDGHTDRIRDGDSVLMSGWEMPFQGASDHLEVRGTTFTAEALRQAVDDLVPDRPWCDLTFTSYVPHSAAAGARWRATVDQLGAAFPGEDAPIARQEAVRLLGHTLLETFPNNLVAEGSASSARRDSVDASPSTVRRAVRVIEEQASDDLSLARLAQLCGVTPRALQYAFRRHLGCTPLAYIRRVRLDLVRQALRDGSVVSVADAGARYGFHNPGRLASHYRQVFDENPGTTLAQRTP